MAICIATLLSLSGSMEQQLSDTMEVYDRMKKSKFRSSDFLVMAAYQIAAGTDSAAYGTTIDRTKAFYDGMKENHRFYTGKDDYIFAAMLGLSDLDIETALKRMEQQQRHHLHLINRN